VKEVTPSLESFWARQSGLFSVLVVVIVSALGFGLDVSLMKEGFPRRDLVLISNVIIGIIAGWLFYQFARNEKARRDAIRQRMRTIADLNHHIRNALQVIRYAGGAKSAQDATQLQLINEAVARIEWALREVLPQYSQTHSDSASSQNEGPASSAPATVVDDFVLRHR
jgi:hypothetical protein